jgi:two-component sensor histidine kinase/PAS domain-containing protein
MAFIADLQRLHGPLSASPGGKPDAENARLAALRRYELLDTLPEVEFDQFATFAADLLDTPVALVSLLDEGRQWFKSRVGLSLVETPRSWSFCEFALRERSGGVFVVPDATADPRFSSNPLVVGGPRFRFYAGAPLLTPEGLALGTLCVLSPEPRPAGLPKAERRQLASLATMAMRGLELRRERLQTARLAREAEARRARELRLRLALDIAGACAWELDPISGLSTWDPAARALLDVPEMVMFEDALRTFVHPDDIGRVSGAVAAALDPAGDGRYSVEHRAARPGPDGYPRWFQSLGQASFGSRIGTPLATRLVCATIEVTERRAAEERRTLLVAELNHRVKNTLAVVLAIAEQTRRATDGGSDTSLAATDEGHRHFHSEFKARLLGLARTHDLLTREAWRGAALAELVHTALAPFSIAAESASPAAVIAGPSVQLAPEPAVTLSIALHELAANAVRHGALSSPLGRVSVTWEPIHGGEHLQLTWVEEGGPRLAGSPPRQGFGTNLLKRGLGRQLGGEVSLVFAAEGFRCQMRLPLGARVRLV